MSAEMAQRRIYKAPDHYRRRRIRSRVSLGRTRNECVAFKDKSSRNQTPGQRQATKEGFREFSPGPMKNAKPAAKHPLLSMWSSLFLTNRVRTDPNFPV
jgi:hypothetical protein